MVLADAVSGLSSVLQPRDGVSVMTLDVQPGVRAQSDAVPGGDGENDVTQFLGSAAATLTLRLWTSAATGLTPEDFLDEIMPLLSPARRPVLTVTNDQWAAPRTLTLRFDSKTAPVDNPVSTDVAISWKVPAGVWQDAAVVEYDVNAQVASATGLIMTVTTGLRMQPTTGLDIPPVSTSGGDTMAVAVGSASPPWTARLYGPCTGPKLANDTTGGDIVFTDSLVLAAGQYVLLDSAARTALLLSDPAQSQLGLLDFAHTSWWRLAPGVTNLIRYHPTSGAGQAQLIFFPARIP
jgi:hypothetical protein